MNYYLNKLMIYHEVHQMERTGFFIQKIAEHLVMDWRTVKLLSLLSEEACLQQLEVPLGRKFSYGKAE